AVAAPPPAAAGHGWQGRGADLVAATHSAHQGALSRPAVGCLLVGQAASLSRVAAGQASCLSYEKKPPERARGRQPSNSSTTSAAVTAASVRVSSRPLWR